MVSCLLFFEHDLMEQHSRFPTPITSSGHCAKQSRCDGVEAFGRTARRRGRRLSREVQLRSRPLPMLSGLRFPAPLAEEAGCGLSVAGGLRFPRRLASPLQISSASWGAAAAAGLSFPAAPEAGRGAAGLPEGEGEGGSDRRPGPERPPPQCRCSLRGSECGFRSPPGTSSEPTRFWR